MIHVQFRRIVRFFCILTTAAAAIDETCQEKIFNGEFGFTDVRDEYGFPITGPDHPYGIGGATQSLCVTACGEGYRSNSSRTVLLAITTWMLPWMSLASQLPSQTKNRLQDFLAILLFVGSPVLGTYSLILTLLNKSWVLKLLRSTGITGAKDQDDQHRITDTNCAAVLVHMLGVPVSGMADVKVFHRYPAEFWEELVGHLRQGRRCLPQSLLAQLVLALFAFGVVLIDTFDHVSEGDWFDWHAMTIALSWLWIIPAVIGWYAAGTMSRGDVIENALALAKKVTRVTDLPMIMFDAVIEPHLAPSDPAPALRGQEEALAQADTSNLPDVFFDINRATHPNSPDRVLGHSVLGDAQKVGCIFTYAKHLPWSQMVENLLPFSIPASATGRRSKSQTSSSAIYRMVIAFFLAVVLQCLTTGMAFLSAYLSRGMGRRCLSLGYLAYFVASTTSAILLIISSMFSSHFHNTSLACRFKSWTDVIIAYAAVLIRICGKTIAYVSAVGIVVHNYFYLYGMYYSCYCSSSGLWSSIDSVIIMPRRWRPEIVSFGLRSTVLSWMTLTFALMGVFGYTFAFLVYGKIKITK
jgi:hypothetical protein